MRKSIVVKIIAVVVAAMLLEGMVIYLYLSYDLGRFSRQQAAETKQFIYEEEQYSLRDLVQMAYSTVEGFYNQSKDIEYLKRSRTQELAKVIDAVHSQVTDFYNENQGDMPRYELEARLKELVAAVRYDGDNYIWINDTRPYMVMHPIKPALDGKDLSGFEDPEGTRLFVEMAEVAKAEGAGMVSYLWEKPGEKEAKLKVSYVRLVPELNWVLGTGAWVEDITARMKQQAMEQVAKMRLSDGNYFWINDLEPRMVMHPIKPELNGQSLKEFEDTKGKKLFVEMAEKARKKGEGTVEYWWGKPGQEGDFPKLSYVKLFEPWNWVIGMGVYMDDVDTMVSQEQVEFRESLNTLLLRALLFGGVFVVLIMALILFLMRRYLSTPLRSLADYSCRVADGHLDADVRGVFRGELARLKESMQSMVASLKGKMAEAQEQSRLAAEEAERARGATAEAEAAKERAEHAKQEGMLQAASRLDGIVERLSTATEELSAQADEINRGTEHQKQRISETATAMEEMNATVLEVARNASSAAENADATQGKAREGADIVDQAVQAIRTVQDMAAELKTNMDALGQQAEAIGQIMNVINDIADQTNLLALNAAIEAARAGEAGRGFAVVADEVRKLAEKTMAATKEVGESIHAIQDAARRNTSSMDSAVKAVEQATELANRSGESLEEIVRLSESTADQVRSIATASEEQSAASEEISRAVDEVNEIATQTSESMHQSVEAQQEVAGQAGELQELIEAMKRENR
jgi:methyl-accepting chemotaxis protein